MPQTTDISTSARPSGSSDWLTANWPAPRSQAIGPFETPSINIQSVSQADLGRDLEAGDLTLYCKVKRNLGILILLLAGLALWAFTREAGDRPGNWVRLEVPDYNSTIVWERSGDRYRSKQSKVVLSLAQVAQLRLSLRGTSKGRDFFALEVGLTPEALRAHREQILKSCYIEKLPAELEHCLDYQTVVKNARGLAFMDLDEFEGKGLTLTIDGNPELRVKHRSLLFSFAQPSSVDCGGESWETCSLAVNDVLTGLFEPESKEHDLMSKGRDFWSEGVWVHDDGPFAPSIWGELVAEHEKFQDLPAFCKRPGYNQLSQTFRIVTLWAPPQGGFFTLLAPLNPASLDTVDWSNEPRDLRPPDPLSAILPIYQRCNAEIMAHHQWLMEWKKSGIGRTIELKVDVNNQRNGACPEWHQAGLPGAAEFELELQQDNRACAHVWLSSRASDSLVTWATSRWLDGMSLNSPCDNHEVILVDTSGRPQRKSLRNSSK
jgi:hypothetical protein